MSFISTSTELPFTHEELENLLLYKKTIFVNDLAEFEEPPLDSESERIIKGLNGGFYVTQELLHSADQHSHVKTPQILKNIATVFHRKVLSAFYKANPLFLVTDYFGPATSGIQQMARFGLAPVTSIFFDYYWNSEWVQNKSNGTYNFLCNLLSNPRKPQEQFDLFTKIYELWSNSGLKPEGLPTLFEIVATHAIYPTAKIFLSTLSEEFLREEDRKFYPLLYNSIAKEQIAFSRALLDLPFINAGYVFQQVSPEATVYRTPLSDVNKIIKKMQDANKEGTFSKTNSSIFSDMRKLQVQIVKHPRFFPGVPVSFFMENGRIDLCAALINRADFTLNNHWEENLKFITEQVNKALRKIPFARSFVYVALSNPLILAKCPDFIGTAIAIINDRELLLSVLSQAVKNVVSYRNGARVDESFIIAFYIAHPEEFAKLTELDRGIILCRSVSKSGSSFPFYVFNKHQDCFVNWEHLCKSKALDRDPLMIAAGDGNLKLVDYLLSSETCSPRTKGRFGITALYSAAEKGHISVVNRLLVETNINVNATLDHFGMTALYAATDHKWAKTVGRLLDDVRTDPEIRSVTKMTAFDCCCSNLKKVVGDVKEICILIMREFISRWSVDSQHRVLFNTANAKFKVTSTVQNGFKFGGNFEYVHHFALLHSGLDEVMTARVLNLIVGVCDGLFKINTVENLHNDATAEEVVGHSRLANAVKFFNVATRVPLELQAKISHMIFGSPKENVMAGLFTKEFKQLVVNLHVSGEFVS